VPRSPPPPVLPTTSARTLRCRGPSRLGRHAVSAEPAGTREDAIGVKLAELENRLNTAETRLGAVDELSLTKPPPPAFDEPTTRDSGTKFRVIAHVRRDGSGIQLTSDVSWPDEWAARSYVAALLPQLVRSGIPDCCCWCEVWAPDEAGHFVDSAVFDQDAERIEWESHSLADTEPS